MKLFEETPREELDWFDACPNADPYLPADEGMKIFDAALTYTRETDRLRVARIIDKGGFGMLFFIRVLHQ